jgi:glycerophosphoryl diester phosphodiesterase
MAMATVIAHRGVWSKDRPENSVAAIAEACRQGYAIETDVRMTRDRCLVLSHDGDLRRVYGLDRLIGRCDASFLEQLCRLEVVLHAVTSARTRLFLHVKELGALDAVIDTVSAEQAWAQTVLFADGSDTGVLVEQCARRGAAVRTGVHLRNADDFRTLGDGPVSCYWLDEAAGGWVNEPIVRVMAERRRMVCIVSPEVWGGRFSRPEVFDYWRQWAQWPVDGVCTDWPVDAASVFVTS